MSESSLPPSGARQPDGVLLLQEVRTLATEIISLREDTQRLSEVSVPRSERDRDRKIYLIIAAALTTLLLVGGIAFGYLINQVQDQAKTLRETAYAACLARERQAARNAATAIEVNALLTSLRDTERQPRMSDDPDLAKVRARRVAAYNRYLAFVESLGRVPSGPKPPPCESYLR